MRECKDTFSKITLKELPRTFCFSPAVMVGTFSIELLLAAYVSYRYGLKSAFNRLTVFLLVLLAVFQIGEYQICSGLNATMWGRIAFIATALMPPVGLHLVSLLTNKRTHIPIAYFFSLCFAAFFALVPGSVSGAICGGNYVMFSTEHPAYYQLYGAYYLIFLLWGIGSSLWGYELLSRKSASVLKWIALGYTSFMLPAAISYVFFPVSRAGFGSILCGFAVFMALILTFAVIPKHAKLRTNNASVPS